MSSSRDQRREIYQQLVGSKIANDRFEVTRLLGFGGMGAVYEATQRNMNRQVALKLIPTHDPTTVARFEREAFTISNLRHPNTVTVFDFGQADHYLFLSMELLEGLTLTDRIKMGPIEPGRAVHIASQICRSLGEAHRNGIVHRDVKPDNIILIQVDDDPDVVKVLDFGIAKAVLGEDDVQLTGDGRIIGTPRYMSPEQILAEHVDLRSDIYSLCCIIFEMLCGAPPFQQSSTTALMISHTQDPPPTFSQRLEPGNLARMPAGLEHVVRKGLSKNPAGRQQSCDELRRELESALAGMLHPPSGEFPDPKTAAAIPSAISNSMMGGAHPTPVPNSFSTAERSGAQSVDIPAYSTHFPAAKPARSTAPYIIAALVLLLCGGAIFYVFAQQEKASDPTPPPVDTAPVREVVAVVPPDPEPTETKLVTIRIESTPPGASVFEDDVSIGTTPRDIRIQPDTTANYRLELEGYRSLPIRLSPSGTDGQVETFRLTKLKTKKTRPPKTSKPVPTKEVAEDKKSERQKPNVTLIEDDEKPNVKMLE